MKRRMIGVVVALCSLAFVADAATFKFACNKEDGVYALGEKAEITVEAFAANDGPPVFGMVEWRLNNFGDTTIEKGVFDLSSGTNRFTVSGTMNEPGFMRLDVMAVDADGKRGRQNWFGVAYDPYNIKPGAECPEDFNDFWKEAVRKYDEAVTAPVKMTRIEDDDSAVRNLYELEIPTVDGRTVWGYLSEPKDLSKGPFPVVVSVPGAGPSVWGCTGDGTTIRMAVNVHYYRPLRGPGNNDNPNKVLQPGEDKAWSERYPVKEARYTQTGIASSREEYFYYGALLAANRAVDWLAMRPEVDRTRFRYSGASQGGGFGLWLCGLNKNFTRAVVYVPALTDLLGFRQGKRESGWPRLVEGQIPGNRESAERNAPYFCGVNFARNIAIPIRVEVGSSDTCCPPMAGFSAFNVMPSKDKEIVIGLGQGHSPFKEVKAKLDTWLYEDNSFAAWPEGKDPATVSRRLADLFLSTSPDNYKPQGYSSEERFTKNGYGGGKMIQYAVVSLWVNALECARLTGDKEREKRLIAAFEPYFGEKAHVLPKFKHVDFTVVGSVPLEIAILNGDARAKTLGLKYADMQWEKPKNDDPPPLYNEMPFEERMKWWNRGYTDQTRLWIDDMYMITVLQSQAYRLTKDRKYIDRAAKEMCLYLDEIQVKDGKDAGLFHHAPDVPFVWGRGAGWMAAGMPMLLQYVPESSPYYAKIKAGYVKMMAALLERQNANGMWNQLVGDRSTWEETSCTAMFGYAFAMGVKHGWLSAEKYGPAARKAYLAIVDRLDAYGNVPDVCCGTGKKNDYAWYRDRPHIHGDPHGQAPLLWMCRAFLEK